MQRYRIWVAIAVVLCLLVASPAAAGKGCYAEGFARRGLQPCVAITRI